MLRDSNHNGVVMKLEGQVIGPWVAEVRNHCAHLLSEGRTLTMNMGGVTYLDGEGVVLVKQLIARHVRLDGCTPFLVELLKAEPSDM